MHATVVKTLQLVIKTYIIMFLVSMIASYLLVQFITHCSISAANLDVCHSEQVIIMKKNLMHVHHMKFFLNAFNDDLNQTFNLITNKIISNYNYD